MSGDVERFIDFPVQEERVSENEARQATVLFEEVFADILLRYADEVSIIVGREIVEVRFRLDVNGQDGSRLSMRVMGATFESVQLFRRIHLSVIGPNGLSLGDSQRTYELAEGSGAVTRTNKIPLAITLSGRGGMTRPEREARLRQEVFVQYEAQKTEARLGLNCLPIGLAEMKSLAELLHLGMPVAE